MVLWLRRRDETLERIEAVAELLIRDHGGEAYAEALVMERQVNTLAERRNWRRVATVIARRAAKPVGLDRSIRIMMHAELSSLIPKLRFQIRRGERDPFDALKRILRKR